jgi:hypothetical protein
LRRLQAHLHRRRQHGHHTLIVTVEQHESRSAEDLRFGRDIGIHIAVPVEMVLRDVEHHGGRRLEALHVGQLEAGQLQHPDLRQGLRVHMGRQRVEQRGADVARHGHGFPGALHQLAQQRGHSGFTVGARDGQHFGPVAGGFFRRHKTQQCRRRDAFAGLFKGRWQAFCCAAFRVWRCFRVVGSNDRHSGFILRGVNCGQRIGRYRFIRCIGCPGWRSFWRGLRGCGRSFSFRIFFYRLCGGGIAEIG